MATGTTGDYRHWIVCGAYASLGAVAERLSRWVDSQQGDIWTAEERARLTSAAELAAEARQQVEALLGPEVRSAAPFRERGTYPEESLGAALIRVQDFADLICAIFTALYVNEDELTAAERDAVARVERLMSEAVDIAEQP